MVQYANQSIDSRCPVCQSADITNLYTVSAEQSAQHFVRKEQDFEANRYLNDHIKELWGRDTCNVNCCNNCSFGFSDPYMSGDYDFYRVAHPRHGYPKWKWENQKTLDYINNGIKTGNNDVNLLEIGAGNGAFVKKVSKIIPVQNITCTEYSDYAVEKIREMGATCHAQDVREFSEEYNNYFNYVCSFQVLEHLDRLDELFEKINKITKEGAKIFFAVPNDKFIEFIETHDALLDMPPNHIGRWNKTSFNVMAERFGWKVLEHEYENADKPLEMMRRFCVYRFMNESQKKGSFANRVSVISNRYVRYALLQMFSVFYGLTSFKGMLKSVSKDKGMAQWVCLSKK